MFIIEIYILVAAFIAVYNIAGNQHEIENIKDLTEEQIHKLKSGNILDAIIDALKWPIPAWKWIKKELDKPSKKDNPNGE